MALDPAIQALFQQMPKFPAYPFWEKPPEDARRAFRNFCAFADPNAGPIGKIETIDPKTSETAPAADVPGLRIYTPVAAGGAALPAILYFHGGGFVLGDLDCYDGLCRALANESGCRVISVDYRLAPEHPFPAATEDAFAALSYVEANASDLGIDPNRIVVAGDSAGANIATVTALRAKENKGNPHIAFQLLIYPITDFRDPSAPHIFGFGYALDDRAIAWFDTLYVPAGTDRADPRLSPLAAADLADLPPALIVTAGFDPLRGQGAAYVEKLKSAGVEVSYVDYPTMIHGFFSMPGLIPLAAEAIAAAAQAVKTALK
jgi:acetyl esterase